MKYILYNKLPIRRPVNSILGYAWIVDYLTNRRYLKFNYAYTLIDVSRMVVKNNNYLLSYNYLKQIIKFKAITFLVDSFRYTKQTLRLHGVGYRVNVTKDSQVILLTIGYSHKLYIKFPKSIFYTLDNNNTCIELASYNYILLTTIISKLKKLHKYDPYKGKGFRLVGELFVPKFYKK